jgi:ABC-type multidrug transport system ATPase subunit
LIHILAGDTTSTSEVTGKILYNNITPNANMPLWQRCGLVAVHTEQNRDLTVLEVITFAMQLRCHNRTGLKVVEENVNTTIENLHLQE